MHTQTLRTSVALMRLAGLCTITFIILLGTISPVEAADWRFEPVLRVAGDFDDNPYLSIRTDADDSVNGYVAEASVKATYRSETTKFFITPTFRSFDYGSGSDLNSDDTFLRFDFNRNTVKTNFRFRGYYSRESTRTAERADTDLEIEDPDEILDDETGVVALRGRRERLTLAPAFTYKISRVNAVSLDLNYIDTRFDEVFAGLLTDYADYRINASFRHRISERTTSIVTATARNYQIDQGNNETKGVGLNVGFSRALSETTRLRAIVGIEDTKLETGETDMNWVADISLVRNLKTIRILAQYRRSIAASGTGELATRDSVNLNFSRKLSDRISAGLGARIYTTNSLEVGPGTFNDRNYVQLRSQFTWHLSSAFSLEANYRFTFLDREFIGESANSNQVTVWFSYHPNSLGRFQ